MDAALFIYTILAALIQTILKVVAIALGAALLSTALLILLFWWTA